MNRVVLRKSVFVAFLGSCVSLAATTSPDGNLVYHETSSGNATAVSPLVRTDIKRLGGHEISLAHLSPLKNQSSVMFKDWDGFSVGKSGIEKIYHPELTKELQARYDSSLARSKASIESPYRFASTSAQQKYDEQNREMAEWTAKEVLNDSVKNMFANADQSAAPVRVANKAKFLLGAESETGPSQTAVEENSRGKALHEKSKGSTDANVTQVADAQERARLKYKMNVIHQKGEVKFTNPIVNTAVLVDGKKKTSQSDLPTLDTSDRVSAQISKNIKPLKMNSAVIYGLNKKVVSVNLSKRLTDNIQCDVTSQRFTNGRTNSAGGRRADEVKMLYSITF